MAIVEMKKIRLILHEASATEALDALQRTGVLELVEVDMKEDTGLSHKKQEVFTYNHISGRLDFAVEFLSRYAEKGSLRESIEGGKLHISLDELARLEKEFTYNDTIDTLVDLEEKMNDARTHIHTLTEEKALLETWSDLDAPLEERLETTRTRTLLFAAGKDAINSFVKALEKEAPTHEVVVRAPDHVAVAVLAEDIEEIRKLAATCKVDPVTLPRKPGTPKAEISRAEELINAENENLIAYETRVREFLPLLPKLKALSDTMFWKKEKFDVYSRAPRTSSTLVFEGWIPKKRVAALDHTVASVTTDFAIEDIDPKDGEEPPAEIENAWFIRPFESITRLYGLPAAGNLDPTAFLAGFFFVFFGLCLADAGYGLVLALASGIPLLIYRLPKEVKLFLQMFTLGGVATALVGFLFGGYFGIEMEYLPTLAHHMQIFDPIKEPLPVMYLALVLGVIQIMFGLVLKIVTKAKSGEIKHALFEQGSWLLLFTTLIVFVLSKIGYIALPGSTAVYAVYTAMALLVLGHGAQYHGIFKKLGMGLLSLYESVGFFSDILSYSRLLALGLASTALAYTMNLIALMAKGVPYIGIPVMIIILIVGHLFTIAIGVLGAFVHSARLQFVEFFGKFIAGSSRTFAPFARKERYITTQQ